MRIDSQLAFVPLGANLSLVAGAGVDIPSNVLDLLGAGVGVAPPSIIGNVATFGTDQGVGGDKQVIQINLNPDVAIAANAGAPTLNVALQAAPDDGTNNPGPWQTITETGELTVAQLEAARTGALQQPIRMDWPPNWPANLNPRFVRLLFQVPAATDFLTGQVYGAFVTRVRDDQANKFAAKNYTVQ